MPVLQVLNTVFNVVIKREYFSVFTTSHPKFWFNAHLQSKNAEKFYIIFIYIKKIQALHFCRFAKDLKQLLRWKFNFFASYLTSL